MLTQESKTYHAPKTLQDKAFFASYLNMARHNAYITLSHITEILGDTPSAEDQLAEMACITLLNKDKEPERIQKSIKLLREHFPFLRFYYNAENIRHENNENDEPVDEKKLYFSILIKLFKELNSFRNEFTHAETPDLDFTKRKYLFFDLDKIFEVAIRKIIDIRNFTEKEVDHLRKFKGAEKVKGKISPKVNPDFIYHFLNSGKDNYTEYGLAFFICLFLEKSYAYKFLKQIKGFKAGNTPKFRATTESFTIFHIHLPNQRINHTDTTSSPIALALDMFNELKKCPKNLFELLSDKDATNFRIEKNSDDETIKDDLLEDLNLVRHSDRFPFFALQYIDQNKLFQSLRFHIDMGNYFHKVYDKTGVDGEKRIRRLKKSLKTFGRLQDMNALRLTKWGDIIKDKPKLDDTDIYMSNTYPHYHIEDNNIGIKLTEIDLPHLPQQPPPINEKPDFWLSIYELPAILFLLLMENKPNERSQVEKLITDYRKRTHQFLKDLNTIKAKRFSKDQLEKYLSDTYRFNINNISPEIKQYLIDDVKAEKINDEFNKYAADKIQELILDSQYKLKRIDEDIEWKQKGKKPGKKGWKEIKSGELGDFLAKDMLWLQPSLDGKGKDKITGQNFQILQASLAYYGRDKHLLESIFNECKLKNSDNPHPFLDKIILAKHDDIVSFYQIYLWKRILYFKQCAKEKQYGTYYFLKPNSPKWNDRFAKYANTNVQDRLINNTLNIPRGFFKEALIDWVKQNGSEALKKVALEERINTVYIIKKYFELDCNNDGSQMFYSYKRSYKVINKLYNERINNNLFKPLIRKEFNTADPAFSELLKKTIPLKINTLKVDEKKDLKTEQDKMKTALSDLKDNERKIRLTKTEDMLLFLMAKRMLFNAVSDKIKLKMADEQFQLRNIKPQPEGINDTTTLSLQLPFQLEYEVYKMDDKNTQKIEKLYQVIIVQENLKAKNYGDFIRFTKDRRLNNLFRWLPANTIIERAVLQKELDNYDKLRINVFEAIHSFETLVLQKLGKTTEGKSLFDKILISFYAAFPAFQYEEKLVKSIRNAFSHNQYPTPDLFNTTEQITIPDIATYIVNIGSEVFNKYISELEQLGSR